MKTKAERYDYWCIQKGMHPDKINDLQSLGVYIELVEVLECKFDNLENPTIMKCEGIDIESASIHCNIFNDRFKMEYIPLDDVMYYELLNK